MKTTNTSLWHRSWMSAAVMLLMQTQLFACEGPDAESAEGAGGTIGLNLVVPAPDNVHVVMYELSQPEMGVLCGTLTVGASGTIALRLGELEARSGYVLKLRAATVDGLQTCTGQTTFDVIADQVRSVSLTLACSDQPIVFSRTQDPVG